MAQKLVELQSTARERSGKGAARQARREGKVPAVIYGGKEPATPINIDYNEAWMQYRHGHFLSTVYALSVDGKSNRVLPREAQVHPVTGRLMHIDFMRVSRDAKIEVNISVEFINEEGSPGLRRGGVLNIVRHEIEVECPADAIPEQFTLDLDGLDIGDTLTSTDIKLPSGVSFVIDDRDFTIATITGAMAEEVEQEAPTAEAGEEAGEDKEKAEADADKDGDGEDKK